jgi:LCP family protein required for cell wall assembly
MVLSGGSIVATRVLLSRYTANIDQADLLGKAGGKEESKSTLTGAANVLLVGIDTRGKVGEPIRADSIIIMHIPADHSQAYLVSVPRDSSVDIPAYPKNGYGGGRAKINAAYSYGSEGKGGRSGGFELLALTIKKLAGITFDAGAIIDFNGFKAVVEALGGVNMCIDERVTSIHVGFDSAGKQRVPYKGQPPNQHQVPGVRPQVYEKGCRHLKDWEALDYVRQRDLLANGDGDYGRQRHQQQFIKAIAKTAMSAGVITNPAKLDSVLTAAGQALTLDSGGISIPDWVLAMRGIAGSPMTMVKTNGGKYQSFRVDGESREQLTPDSLALFQAVKQDKVGDFIAAHPDWVSDDK